MTSAPVAQPVPEYVQGHGLLDGRVVVITAAAGAGIGSALGRRCLEEGAKAIVIGDVHEPRLASVTERLRQSFGEQRVASVICDVSKESEIGDMLDAAETFGGVDTFINNAGLGGSVPILDMTDEQWSQVLDV